ncbi:MAG: glycosyltransferase family 39 protein, partial [Actinomycetota bacterium]|nr:glycosyltransferase family 39 protein [Actinomycetota bacterium]
MTDKNKGVLDNFKINIYLVVVIVVFIILCVSYVLVIPVFEAPDEPGHFLYAYYISKYNKLPSQYNESISTTGYIKENIDENADKTFYTDSKYMFYKIRDWGVWYYRDQRHQPPLYYLISSQIIKPFGVSDIDAEINYENYNDPNRFINNSILRDSSSTNFLVLILRLFQVIYGVLIIIFVYKIIELISNGRFERKSALLISGIAFLPQFLFLCSYVNNDVLSVLFGLISVYFAVLLFKRDKAYFGLLSILFSIIASLTKPTILIMVPLAIAGLIVWAVTRKGKWGILGIFVILFLIGAGFYLITGFGKESYKDVKVEVGWDGNYREGSELSSDEKVDGKGAGANYGISLDGKSNRISVLSTPYSVVGELTVESQVYFNKFNKSAVGISTPVISDWNLWSPDNQKGYLLRTYYSPESDSLSWQFIVCDGAGYRTIDFDFLPYDDFTQKYANKWLHIA